MLRLPNNALQKALIKLLKEKMQGVAVYDFVPIEATPPYITLGSIVVTDQSTKTEDNYKVDMQINIWSEYEGRYEINHIAQQVYPCFAALTAIWIYLQTALPCTALKLTPTRPTRRTATAITEQLPMRYI